MKRGKTRKLNNLKELKIGMRVMGVKSRLEYQITEITPERIVATRLQEISNTDEWKIID